MSSLSRTTSISGRCDRGKWSPGNIAAMVLGFVFFWPVGLVILYWIISGRNVQELPGAVKQKWMQFRGNESVATVHPDDSDNSLFNEFQQTQYDRISEIKEEIRERAQRFREFRDNAQRRADEEEFNRFMATGPAKENS